MAIGMKHWLAMVAASMALIAIWALPPRGSQARTAQFLPEETAFIEASADMRRAHGAVQVTRWADSLAALAIETAEDGLALGVPEDHAITDGGVAEWRDMLEATLRSGAGPRSEVVLGFFVQPVRHGRIPNTPVFSYVGSLTYVGILDGTPYCLQVAPALSTYRNRDLRGWFAYQGLGGCSLYARYGMPGEAMQAWLGSGGLAFGAVGGERTELTFNALEDPRVPMFGLYRIVRYWGTPESWRCISGDAVACERFVLRPEARGRRGQDLQALVESTPVTQLGRPYVDELGPNTRFLFADLEAEFGEEAMADFWTSELAPAEAFADAFGIPMGEWILSWIDSELGLYRAGPTMPASSWWLSLLTLTTIAAVVSGAARRRRVG